MKSRAGGPLPARDAYRLWAPTYGTENPVTALDQVAIETLTPPLVGLSLLDAGCGTGRRLPDPVPEGPKFVVGIDLVREMLTAGRNQRPDTCLVAGDLEALPIARDTFDVVWCRLALGHLAAIAPAYRELARIARPGARLIVTDFHPAAVHAGYIRSFRDASGNRCVVEHHVHEPLDHEQAAAGTGLSLEARLDLCVGPEVRRFYENAEHRALYERQRGLPVVLALRFAR